MTDTVFFRNYREPEFNKEEVMRYALCPKDGGAVASVIEECLSESKGTFGYNVCFCELPIAVSEGKVKFPFAETNSKALSKNLCGCDRAIIFAATVGLGIDRLISRYGRISPAKSLIFSAIGAERIEALCDSFNLDIKNEYEKKGLYARPRFSPGYGDFPIEFQRELFKVLDCNRKIGLTLNDSLIMSPSKSVTAVIGLCSDKSFLRHESCGGNEENKCKACDNKACAFRSEN